MAFAFRAMHSLAAAAPLRASAARRVSARVPAARVAVRAMADDAPEGPPVHELIDVRVGKVLKASKHEDADKLYVEEIDLGEAEPRTICSGLAPYMAAEVRSRSFPRRPPLPEAAEFFERTPLESKTKWPPTPPLRALIAAFHCSSSLGEFFLSDSPASWLQFPDGTD